MLAPIVLAILVAQAPFGPGGDSATQQPPASPAQTTLDKPWPPAGVFRTGASRLTLPRLIKQSKPNYTAEAMKAKIEGGIVMEVVVRADGTVGEVRVVRSLDKKYGLDEQAVDTVKQWRFAPGKKDGVAVPVLVDVEMTFSLR